MIFVYLDTEQRRVYIYKGKNAFCYDWRDLLDISAQISGEACLYVTDAEMVDGQSVVDLLAELQGLTPEQVASGGKKYMRSTLKGKCSIPVGDKLLVFDGPCHFIPLDEEQSIFAKIPVLQSMLDAGKIEVVNESRKRQLQAEADKRMKKFEDAKAKKADSVLIKTSVDDFINNSNSEDGSIDIGPDQPLKDEEQEVLANIRKLGIKE